MRTFTEQLLDALPPPGEPVTTASLVVSLGEEKSKRVIQSVERLRRRGFVSTPDRGVYLLTSAGVAFRESGKRFVSGPNGQKAGRCPRPGGAFRAALWAALRLSDAAVTVTDLLSLIPETVHGKASISNAHRYLAQLHKEGYIIALAKREAGTALTSNGFKRWRLIKNTGPRPPYWSPKHEKLIDPNVPGDGA